MQRLSKNGRLRVGYFAQHNLDYLDPNLSALSFCAREFPGKTDEDYRRHLGAFGITGTTGLQKMELLSGGQKSRVAFACLGLTNPQILVLDEPTNHLDVEAMDALSDALKAFQGGVLMVSHDVTILQSVCTSLWVCENGRVEHFDGTVQVSHKQLLRSCEVDANLDRSIAIQEENYCASKYGWCDCATLRGLLDGLSPGDVR